MLIGKRIIVFFLIVFSPFSVAQNPEDIKKLIINEFINQHSEEKLDEIWQSKFDLKYDKNMAVYNTSRSKGNKWIIEYSDKRKPLQTRIGYHLSDLASPIEAGLSTISTVDETVVIDLKSSDGCKNIEKKVEELKASGNDQLICVKAMSNDELLDKPEILEKMIQKGKEFTQETQHLRDEFIGSEAHTYAASPPCKINRWTLARKEACAIIPLIASIISLDTGRVIGTISFTVTQSFSLSHLRSTFQEINSIAFIAAEGVWQGSTINQVAGCTVGCNVFISTLPLGQPINVPSAIGSLVEYHTQTSSVHLFQAIHGIAVGPNILNSVEWVSPLIRCDAIARAGTKGCIFPQVIPTMTSMKDGRIPQIRRNIQRIQSAGPNHYGRMRDGRPLQRTTDESIVSANRRAACPPPNGSTRPGSDWNCDEYPFARTLQGASQTQLPDWGSTWVYESQNSIQGGLIGSFFFQNRILNLDKFWVDVD